MRQNNPLKGHITVVIGTEKTKFSFDVRLPHAPAFKQTLLTSFEGHHLTDDEKRLLTREMRSQLAMIQNVSCERLLEWGTKLSEFLDVLAPSVGQDVGLKASGLGGHICMAALLSGLLGRHRRYSLQLEDSPLALFPHDKKTWSGPNLAEHEVILKLGGGKWPAAFESLCHFPGPKGLRLSYAKVSSSPKRRSA